MVALAPESSLLRAALRRNLCETASEATPLERLETVNWNHLLWLARQEGVLPLLGEALQATEYASACPLEVRKQLDCFREVCQLRALARVREIIQLQDVFEKHHLDVLTIDPLMTDLNGDGQPAAMEVGTVVRYLVSHHDRDRAESVLSAAGYSVKANIEKLVTLGKSPVHVSHRAVGKLTAESLLAAADALSLGGRRVRTLPASHWLVLRAAECSVHEALPLIRAHVIAKLARRLSRDDWTKATELANQHELLERVAAIVQHSHRMLDLPLPADAVESLGADRPSNPLSDASSSPRPVARAPFLPTPARVMDRMLELAHPMPDDLVYDLGCGDGRFLVEAAKRYGARGVGVDINPERIAEAQAFAVAHGVADRVSFSCSDALETDLSAATVLCLYLMPPFFPRIRERLQREGKPGMRIVSHDYSFPDWPPDQTELMRSGPMRVAQIYFWRLP